MIFSVRAVGWMSSKCSILFYNWMSPWYQIQNPALFLFLSLPLTHSTPFPLTLPPSLSLSIPPFLTLSLSPSTPPSLSLSLPPFLSFSLEYKEYILNLWDVGGQKSIRTYWRNYFELTDGIIWVSAPSSTVTALYSDLKFKKIIGSPLDCKYFIILVLLLVLQYSAFSYLSLSCLPSFCPLHSSLSLSLSLFLSSPKVVDSVDRWRLEECRKQLRDILRQEKLAGASLLIFANKQDLGEIWVW